MGIRWKIPTFMSQDDPTITLVAGDGIDISAEEVDHIGVEVTITNTGIEPPVPELIATFSKAGALTTGTGTGRFLMPAAGTVVGVVAAINTPPTGANLICDVNKNGASIFTTQANRPVIAAGANATAATAVPDITAFFPGDYYTVDIDQVGSSVAGSDLVVQIIYTLS